MLCEQGTCEAAAGPAQRVLHILILKGSEVTAVDRRGGGAGSHVGAAGPRGQAGRQRGCCGGVARRGVPLMPDLRAKARALEALGLGTPTCAAARCRGAVPFDFLLEAYAHGAFSIQILQSVFSR